MGNEFIFGGDFFFFVGGLCVLSYRRVFVEGFVFVFVGNYRSLFVLDFWWLLFVEIFVLFG